MNGLPYYKAYPRDFIEGTVGMSFELKGAYRLVLDLIYLRSGNCPMMLVTFRVPWGARSGLGTSTAGR